MNKKFNNSHPPSWLRAFSRLTFPLIFASAAVSSQGVDLTDDFDGSSLDQEVWELTGSKTIDVSGGMLTWNNDGGNWASGDISTVQEFYLPPPGETTVITWTLGPGSITTENPNSDTAQSIRYQIGIHSANETAARKEHWANSTGGVWIDFDNITPGNTAGLSGGIYSANDTKVSDSQGAWVAGANVADWNWQSDTHEFRLEMTDTEFAWYNGGEFMGGDTWENVGIDTEFSNGYRVLAIGMNYDAGRGFTSIDRVDISNAGAPSSLVSSFSADPLAPVSGQPVTFSWNIDPDASATIDQGVGSVDAQTTEGSGQIQIIAPDVSVLTAIAYTLTVTQNGEEASRALTLNVAPAPELIYDNVMEDFEGDTLDTAAWEHRGSRTYTVADGMIHWDPNGDNWGHGEVDSVNVFPMPAPGKKTTIKWTLGPSEVTVEDDDGFSLRPMMGVFSAYEKHTWSRQHWQNTTGGVWLDITEMGTARTDGVTGGLIYANDTKAVDSNGTWLASFDVPDWNWQTEGHEFSLVISDLEYSWYSGETLLGSGTWDEAGIDTEFSNGFKIMMMAGNSNIGRGPMSLDTIEVINGGVPNFFAITDVARDQAGVHLTWQSSAGKNYEVYRQEAMRDDWSMIGTSKAQSESTSFTDAEAASNSAFYTVANIPAQPVFSEDFESGASGWTKGDFNIASTTQWELGTPAAGQVPDGAHSGENVYGTDLDADYQFDTMAYLRTPVIDLTGVTTATLTYWGYQDIEPLFEGMFVDFLEIWILDSNGQRIQTNAVRKRAGSTAGWQQEKIFLPAEVLDRPIMIEFHFTSDSFNAIDENTSQEITQAGWFIDDVAVVPE